MKLFQVPVKYILLTSLLLKAIYLLVFVHHIRTWEDQVIAENIVRTGKSFINMDGRDNSSFQFPVYPYIISALYFTFGLHPIIACFYNLLMNIFCSVIFVKLLWELMNYFQINFSKEKTNAVINISLLLFVIHPAINYYTLYNVHPFMQNMFFLFLIIFLSFKYGQNINYRNSLIFGLALGIAVLDRGTALMALIPFIILALKNKGLKTTIIHTSIICLLGFLVCTPWLIHNYIKDDFIGIESSSGKDMYKGILEGSEGSNYLSNGKNYYDGLSRRETDSASQISVGAQNHYYMSKVYGKFKSDPGFIIKMFFLKLKNYWWFRSLAGNEQSELARDFIPIYKITYLLLIIFVAISFFKIGLRVLTLLSVPIAVSLLQAAFYVETRHRIIIEPLLIFVAVVGIFLLLQQAGKTK